MANEKEFPLGALFCDTTKEQDPKLEVVKIPSVNQTTEQILGDQMKNLKGQALKISQKKRSK
jgi:hypothetical protein